MEHRCVVCNKEYASHSYLRRHVKIHHADRLNEIAPNKTKECRTVCNKCSTTFTAYSSLKTHVMKFHPDKVQELTSPKLYQYQCEECKKNFSHKRNYKSHKKTHANASQIEEKRTISSRCTLCGSETVYKSDLLKHFHQAHDINIMTKKLDFPNQTDFDKWKADLEKDTCSKYVNNHGARTTSGNGLLHLNYVCHRSGFYARRGSGKRHLKTQGSNKINGLCPSKISVQVSENGKCEVQFTQTHVGHDQDLGHLSLTAAERMEVASKIASKVPFSSILDDIRDSVTENKLERIHLLTRKDLHNITHSFNLNNEAVRHQNDAISVESWVKEMEDTGTVLYYKPQGEQCKRYPSLKEDDFVIIIMHPGQLEMLNKFDNDCVCIDGTHGLNAYQFELTTLMVLDDMREGFPCCFLFSNRSDEHVMQIFFKEIREKLGRPIESQVFMSDMAPSYYNAWLEVMGPTKFRLFCAWHVDRAWRKNLNKIDGQEMKSNVYKQLRTLLQERDQTAFSIMLQNFAASTLASPETLEFGRYFSQHYLNNVESWAYCYRLHAGVNTNMHIERMHHTIKYLYLNGKNVQRLDKTINILMKFVRDKLFERLITINKGKISSKINNLRTKHSTSEQLRTDLVLPSEVGWEVLSTSSKELYLVEEKKGECDCKIICELCHACIHSYSCSCLDNSIRWNMCKHIHLVCRYRSTTDSSSTSKHIIEGSRFASFQSTALQIFN